MAKRRPQGLDGQDLIDWVYENKTEKDSKTGCRIWTGYIGTAYSPLISYGKSKGTKKSGNVKVSRLFWEISRNKKIPEGMIVGHTCESTSPDHHLCVNVDHFKLQTSSENMHKKYESHKERGIEHKLNPPQKRKSMPRNMPHKDRVQWLIENRSKPRKWTDGTGKTWDCLEWTGNMRNKPIEFNDNGIHGITFNRTDSNQSIALGAKTVSISRYILFVLNEIDYLDPKNKSIVCRHKCGFGKCINPEHLEPGTQRQNLLDARNYHSGTKINEDIVKIVMENAIQRLSSKDFSSQSAFNREWAQKLSEKPYEINCSPHTINNFLWRRICWEDVTEPYQIELNKAKQEFKGVKK